MIEYEFELKLADGKIVNWVGANGEAAARRYVANDPGAVVVAWRHPRVDIHVGIPIIVEPGDKGFLTQRAPDLKRAARKSDKSTKPAVSSG